MDYQIYNKDLTQQIADNTVAGEVTGATDEGNELLFEEDASIDKPTTGSTSGDEINLSNFALVRETSKPNNFLTNKGIIAQGEGNETPITEELSNIQSVDICDNVNTELTAEQRWDYQTLDLSSQNQYLSEMGIGLGDDWVLETNENGSFYVKTSEDGSQTEYLKVVANKNGDKLVVKTTSGADGSYSSQVYDLSSSLNNNDANSFVNWIGQNLNALDSFTEGIEDLDVSSNNFESNAAYLEENYQKTKSGIGDFNFISQNAELKNDDGTTNTQVYAEEGSKFANSMLSAMDTDSSNGVDIEEFTNFEKQASGIVSASQTQLDSIEQMFDAMDLNNDGVLSSDEIQSVYSVIDMADGNADGEISYDVYAESMGSALDTIKENAQEFKEKILGD